MTEDLDHILIFKSNIQTEADKCQVSTVLDIHPHIATWSVDMHDDDRILRVVSAKLDKKNITDLVALCGYQCEELPD